MTASVGDDEGMQMRVEAPLSAGSKLTIWLSAGENHTFGPEPFRAGQGFTLESNGARWRAVLLNAETAGDGSGVSLSFELEDSTPVGYWVGPAV
jgi:hypothetical protein